jgi:hypothetical protein
MSLQVTLSDGILSALLRRQAIVVLHGNATLASPTLEPRPIERIFLCQAGECQIKKLPPKLQFTILTFSIL